MNGSASTQRSRGFSLRDSWLLAEALSALALASMMVRLYPFRRIVALAEAPLAMRAESPAGVDRLRRAVEAWARRVPWKALCIQRALALHLMLRRRGVASILHYGISRPGEGELSAHVWLSLDGETILGGEAASDHIKVADFRPTDSELGV